MARLHINIATGNLTIGSSVKPARNSALASEKRRALVGLNKATALAGEHGIDVVKGDGGGWWVTCSRFASGRDPLDGNNFCADGLEVLDAVQAYVIELGKLSNQLPEQGQVQSVGDAEAGQQQNDADSGTILVAYVSVSDETLIVEADKIGDALTALHGSPMAGHHFSADIRFEAMIRSEFEALSEFKT